MKQAKQLDLGRMPGLVVMWGDSISEGRGFESQHCIIDGHFFTYIVVKMFVWKDENKQIRGRDGPFKKQVDFIIVLNLKMKIKKDAGHVTR